MMSFVANVLAFVRSRLGDARRAPASDYRDGAIEELEEVEEYIVDNQEEWNDD